MTNQRKIEKSFNIISKAHTHTSIYYVFTYLLEKYIHSNKQNAPDIKAFSRSSYLLWKMNEIKAKHIRSNNSPHKRRTFPCKCQTTTTTTMCDKHHDQMVLSILSIMIGSFWDEENTRPINSTTVGWHLSEEHRYKCVCMYWGSWMIFSFSL